MVLICPSCETKTGGALIDALTSCSDEFRNSSQNTEIKMTHLNLLFLIVVNFTSTKKVISISQSIWSSDIIIIGIFIFSNLSQILFIFVYSNHVFNEFLETERFGNFLKDIQRWNSKLSKNNLCMINHIELLKPHYS